MPSIRDFIGPKPEPVHKVELEKILGNKPCSKCDDNVSEAFWDPMTLTMSWTCANEHTNTYKVN